MNKFVLNVHIAAIVGTVGTSDTVDRVDRGYSWHKLFTQPIASKAGTSTSSNREDHS